MGALGDLLVGLASLFETHELFPSAEVTVIGPKLWTEILEPAQAPFVRRLVIVERKSVEAREFTVQGGKWVEVSKPTQQQSQNQKQPLWRLLQGEDAIVNTNIDSLRYGFTALRARIPMRIGTAPAASAWVYTHVAPFFGKDPMVHERDAALLLLEFASAGLGKYFRSTERNRANLDDWITKSQLIAKWRKRGLPSGKAPNLARARELTGREPGTYVLVNPTSSRREKAWPSERFLELMKKARETLESRGLEILVLGSPAETEWLKEAAGSEFRIVQPPTIQDLQDVLSGAQGLLTNTSSVQFIAAMTGTPVLTLMGRAQPEIWGPIGPRDSYLRGRPPAELAHDIFLHEQAGYRSIEVEEVLPRFLELGIAAFRAGH